MLLLIIIMYGRVFVTLKSAKLNILLKSDVYFNIVYSLFKALALWADAFYKSKCLSVCPCVCTKHGGNHASRWITDLRSKGVLLILAYL